MPLAFLKTVYFFCPVPVDVDEPAAPVDVAAVANCCVCPEGVFKVMICWPLTDEHGRVFTTLPMLAVLLVPTLGLLSV